MSRGFQEHRSSPKGKDGLKHLESFVLETVEGTPSPKGAVGGVGTVGQSSALPLRLNSVASGNGFSCIFCGCLERSCCLKVPSAFFYPIAAKPRET